MTGPPKKKATYQDVLDAPEHKVAEVVGGELYLSPRPGGPHSSAEMNLAYELLGPFGRGRGGPGGWLLLIEPELHLGYEPAIVVPDIAAWRRERMPYVPETAKYFTIAPDWLCEVISPSTGRFDRAVKMPLYAQEGVRHVWIVDPPQRTVEVFRNEGGKWLLLATHSGEEKIRAEPFEAVELDLHPLWADVRAAAP
jgi:Uma2 family endonuclease